MANIALPPNETTLTEEQVGKGLEVSTITPNYLKHGYIKFTLQNIGKNSSEMKDITILSNYKNLQEILERNKIGLVSVFENKETLYLEVKQNFYQKIMINHILCINQCIAKCANIIFHPISLPLIFF